MAGTIKTKTALDTEITTNVTQNTNRSNTGQNVQDLLENINATVHGDTFTLIDDTDSPYTLDYDAQSVLVCDTSSGAITVNLPAIGSNPGKSVTILCTSASNDVTIDPDGSETINGTTSATVTGAYAAKRVTNNGTTHYAF